MKVHGSFAWLLQRIPIIFNQRILAYDALDCFRCQQLVALWPDLLSFRLSTGFWISGRVGRRGTACTDTLQGRPTIDGQLILAVGVNVHLILRCPSKECVVNEDSTENNVHSLHKEYATTRCLALACRHIRKQDAQFCICLFYLTQVWQSKASDGLDDNKDPTVRQPVISATINDRNLERQ